MSSPEAVSTTTSTTVTGTLASLRYPEYRRLWLAGLVVFMAVNAQNIARGWLARQLTGTNAGLGGVLLAFGIAMLIATPFGGVAADRLSKRTVLLAAQFIFVVSSFWIGLAVQLDFIEYWMLVAAGAMQAVGFALYAPARMAFVAELVPPETMSNAIVLGQMSAEGMRVVGPTAAGVTIGAVSWGLASVFLACGVLSTVAMGLGAFLPAGRPKPGRPERSPLADMRDGLDYVRGREDLALLIMGSLGVVIAGYPYIAFMPTIADGIFDRGSAGYGLLAAASAAGAVVAGFFTAGRGGREARFDDWRFLTTSGFGFGISLVLLGLAPTFYVALLVLSVTGGVALAFQTTVQSLLLTLSDFDYHGRIQSLIMLGFSGFGIAALPLGMLADAIGLRPTLALMGAVMLTIMTLFAARRRRFRDRDLLRDVG